MSPTSLALNNLRAFVILIVLAFHSSLAYLYSLPATAFPFNAPPYKWLAFPIVDGHRWLGFDLFCAFQDVYLMSFMFFLSGLFVWPSLLRKGSWKFLQDRLLRLGLPFLLIVYLLMPITHYPVYRVTAIDPSVSAFWRHWLALPFWPDGPLWFLAQLMLLDIAAAAVYRFAPSGGAVLRRLAAAGAHPIRFFFGLAAASAVAYVPLALAFTPWDWWESGPLAVQLSRPLHYAVYFFAGVGIGAYGIDRGLLAIDGMLARGWRMWLAAAALAFVLWMGATALTLPQGAVVPLGLALGSDFAFVLSCATGCLFIAAVFLRYSRKRSRVLDSLSANAYGMYLVHFVFTVWMQYLLLGAALFVVAKAAVVFIVSLLLSWSVTAALRRGPFSTRLLGEGPPALAAQTRAAGGNALLLEG